MRTTITLDDDVAAKLVAESRRSGRPFKQVVNDTLRAGLTTRNKRRLPPFEIPERDLVRLKAAFNWDKIEDVFDRVDGADRLR